MKAAPTLPATQFRKGWNALVGTLGLIDALRFVVDLERGHGDSVKELAGVWKDRSARQVYRSLARARAAGRLPLRPAASS